MKQFERFINYTKMDGVIQELFNRYKGETTYCVEFGSNTQGGNTDCLSGAKLLLDGECMAANIENLCTDNILEIFEKYKVPVEFDYLSVDVDSIDIHLADKILSRHCPKFFSIEYNPRFLPTESFAYPDCSTRWTGGKNFGSSALAIAKMASRNHYNLVYIGEYPNSAHDLIFVRSDLCCEEIPLEYTINKMYDNSSEDIWIGYP